MNEKSVEEEMEEMSVYYNDSEPTKPYRPGETYLMSFYMGTVGSLIARHPMGKIVIPIGNELLTKTDHGDLCRVLIHGERQKHYIGSILEVVKSRADLARQATRDIKKVARAAYEATPEEQHLIRAEQEIAEQEADIARQDAKIAGKARQKTPGRKLEWLGPETVRVTVQGNGQGGKLFYGVLSKLEALAKGAQGKNRVLVRLTADEGRTRMFLANMQKPIVSSAGSTRARIYLGDVLPRFRSATATAEYLLLD